MMTNSSLTWDKSQAVSGTFTYLDTVDSTNSWLMRKDTVVPGEVVLTLNQTEGRGRWTRSWTNQPGDGIALSLVVPPLPDSHSKSASLTWIPLLVGVVVVDAVRLLGLSDATLKWPNDVLVDGHKLAGVLCEVRTDGFVIAGIGINLKFSSHRPDERALSLDEALEGADADLDLLVAGIIQRLSRLIEGGLDQWRPAVTRDMGTLGRNVLVHARDGSRHRGRAIDLDEQGALSVRLEDGALITVTSSDIEHLFQ